jgi:tricorn protease
MRLKTIIPFMLVLLIGGSAHCQSEARLLRFPAIYENLIVFSYAGDLYSVSPQAAQPAN